MIPNMNVKTGYPYGVMSANASEDAHELAQHIFDDGVNLSLQTAQEELRHSIRLLCEPTYTYEEAKEALEAAGIGLGWSLCYFDGGKLLEDELLEDAEQHLFDYWDSDGDTYELLLGADHRTIGHGQLEKADPPEVTTSYLLGSLGGAGLIWVTNSQYVTNCRACSPCVPGAGDLDSPDPESWLAHCPPPEDLDYKEAGYATVWKIEADGELTLVYSEKEHVSDT